MLPALDCKNISCDARISSDLVGDSILEFVKKWIKTNYNAISLGLEGRVKTPELLYSNLPQIFSRLWSDQWRLDGIPEYDAPVAFDPQQLGSDADRFPVDWEQVPAVWIGYLELVCGCLKSVMADEELIFH